MPSESTTRPYTKRRRAESEAATRQRIAEAAMELHGSVGPARTTISAVADRAGVQRATVYRHFPDEVSLFGACTAHWYSLHPPPDPSRWAEIADHDTRLRAALEALYEWYGSDEQMFVNTFRDAPVVPAMTDVFAGLRAGFDALVETIVNGRPERGRRRARILAAVAHAASFGAWYSLTREGGLTDEEAIDTMLGAVEAAGS